MQQQQQQQQAARNTVPTQEMAQGAAYMAVARTSQLPRGRIQRKAVVSGAVCPQQQPNKSQDQRGQKVQKGQKGQEGKKEQKEDQSKKAAAGKQPKKDAGTGGPAVISTAGKKKKQNNNRMRDEVNVPMELVQNAGVLAFRFLWGYWLHVRPVFRRRSALRERLRSGCLTFADAVLCVLAAGFVLTVVLLGVVVFRVLVVVGIVCQYTSTVLSLLLGM